MKDSVRPTTRSLTLIVLCLIASATGRAVTMAAQDGPVSVTYGGVYKRGELKIEPDDLTKLPPLPQGYVAMNNQGYRISTTATVSGPHKVFFNATSVREEEAFRSLRIFQLNLTPSIPTPWYG